ncbi:MAG TPA: nicotinate (nicotinamide) nucleotide adenylyltransferase [Haploplasma sp.]|nr:nicotinate (nicotinamide) nucleotide adenylyltransferase [Haploplasma sp.]
MNIVYGGSFNPPTKAHLEIVDTLLLQFPQSKVIILPVGNNYSKKSLINFNDRFMMLELMFSNNSRVIVSNLEDTNVFKGTYDSLKTLNLEFEDLYLVIGSDNLHNFNKWIKYQNILQEFSLIIFRRNEDDIAKLMEPFDYLKPNYQIVKFDNEINSTVIRSDIERYRHYLDTNVYQYIKKNKLYEVDEDV